KPMSHSQPRFSVCIPNYNYGHYLGQTIESVLNQTFQDFEIIVADNASTDDSVAVVESFGSDRIRLLRNRYNIGFSPNLDRATRSATGEYMILLSSDDLMRPDALEIYDRTLTQAKELASRTVLTSAYDVIDAEGALQGVGYRPEGDLFYRAMDLESAKEIRWEDLPVERTEGHAALRQTLRRKDSPAAFLTTCYPRTLYEEIEGYNNNQRIWPDSHFLNKMLSRNPLLTYVPRRLFAYRVHSSNQLAGEAKSGALTYQVDSYMHTVEFPQDVLDEIGVKRDDLVAVFVRKAVMERGLQALVAGHWSRGLRTFIFGFATYPVTALRTSTTYGLALLLALGPLGILTARFLYRRRTRAGDTSRTS
ncbi:MAG: glycosyltransferase family A protein, partial [Rhodothermales bacterium]|nr:glycosyltransferase family A protein [Rhodothermales bacterium]